MRIMHVTRSAEVVRSFLIPVITEQKKLGHDVSVCTKDAPDVVYLRSLGFDIFVHNLRRSLNPLLILESILRIKRILTDQQAEIVICHNALGALAGRIAAWLAKTPHIVYFVHGLACAPAQGAISWQLRYWTEKILGCTTDAVVVMNDYDEKLCKKHRIIKDSDKVFRVPGMGVDLGLYNIEGAEEAKHILLKELRITESQKIILSVARLIPDKGIFVFLEAARRICSQRKDVCFLLVGRGPSMGKLRKIIETNHLANSFKLFGWRDDISQIMKAADIFVLPTYFMEGMPVSILEAMACSKPVIATQHRGCEDAVEDGKTGFLVPVKQAGALVDKILSLLDDEPLQEQMGRAGRRRAEQYFGLDYCTDKIVMALEKAIR